VTGAKQIVLTSFINSIAGGTASFLNTFFMRKVEMKNGIEIYEDEALTKKLYSGSQDTLKSKECARRAIFETAWSRVFLSITCLMTPAFIFYLVEKAGKTPKSPLLKVPYETGVFIFALMVGLPASIAMFP
jgi:Sideroflexins